jgi:hypothetical protein
MEGDVGRINIRSQENRHIRTQCESWWFFALSPNKIIQPSVNRMQMTVFSTKNISNQVKMFDFQTNGSLF